MHQNNPIQFMDKPYTDEETFNVLCPLVRDWFKEKFKAFSPPQKYSVMNIHRRENTLISSPTGSGKTLSAFTAILNELIQLSAKGALENKVYCIYVSPLKALANDIEKNLNQPLEELKKYAESKIEGSSGKIDIRVSIRTGDTTNKEKTSMLKKAPHILITTPESLGIMLTSPKFRENLDSLEWVIIDEIHAIASSKRGTQLSVCIERLQSLNKKKNPHSEFTRIGLSATVSPLEKVAQFLVGMENFEMDKFRPCKIIDVQNIKKMDLKVLSPVPNLIESDYKTTHDKMYNLLDKLIQEHKTTLIFTNTRSATERVVHHLKDKFPKNYVKLNEPDEESEQKAHDLSSESTYLEEIDEKSYIGAHHSSLSKEHRLNIENRLKEGKLKCVVSSTSLELGIDIGYIDLVILLGSPKGVARALQRIGRSGHKLHEVSKGRIIVLDRDDLVECSVLLKAAIEHKIDNVNIPENSLDVLSQEIYGMAIEEQRSLDEIYQVVKSSYAYRNLERKDFIEVIRYLTGQYVSLEDRNVYAKIWYDESNGMIGKKGKMARVLYMTNIGTIPDESFIKVKIQGAKIDSDDKSYIGKIDENFLERLKRGDVFVLGGNTYEFLYAQGMTAFVKASHGRAPTVPSWASETLPLSFDLSLEIQKFRRMMNDYFEKKSSREEIIEFINRYLYLDEYGANAIYEYFKDQYEYSIIPHDKRITIEYFTEGKKKFIIFHTLYGRRVNDVLSRVLSLVISKIQHKDVEININDNGFYISTEDSIQASKAFSLIKSKDLRKIAEMSLDKSEVLARRFRHCATRSMMILRTYMGNRKSVGRQQVSSRLLINSVRRISEDFPILKEARREILEDLMDIKNAEKVIEAIEHKRIALKETYTDIPSPFAFNIITMGYTDIMKMEDKLTFLKRMHDMVHAKISLKEGKRLKKIPLSVEASEEISDKPAEIPKNKKDPLKDQIFNYDTFWKDQENQLIDEKEKYNERLKSIAWALKNIPYGVREHIVEIIDGKKKIREDFIEAIKVYKQEIIDNWPEELRTFLFDRLIELNELPKEFLE
ncbi:MAG TPA: DEAD/DEAH box helicase [Alphaproteobacteria bacterium]|nr:DEAD/DEAH box helicase [Alphaproteobacteria bacterium]